MTDFLPHSGFPCTADLTFYQSRHMPLWARRGIRVGTITIDGVVNAHAGIRMTSAHCAAHNLIWLLANAIRRGKLDAMLIQLAEHPQCIDAKKRAAFARKWALRLGLNPAPYASGSNPCV